MTLPHDIVERQIAYYRARAGEYEEWFYRKGRYDLGEESNALWFAEVARIRDALFALGRFGDALEFACGTGIWTAELVKICDRVTAVDAAPETVEINKAKLSGEAVEYHLEDIFHWTPDREYDLVFFAFWISHIPPDLLDSFLQTAFRAARPGGRLFLIDGLYESTATAKDHILGPKEEILRERKLKDGSLHHIVKVFHDPAPLRQHLEQAGFQVEVKTTPTHFIYAEGLKP